MRHSWKLSKTHAEFAWKAREGLGLQLMFNDRVCFKLKSLFISLHWLQHKYFIKQLVHYLIHMVSLFFLIRLLSAVESKTKENHPPAAYNSHISLIFLRGEFFYCFCWLLLNHPEESLRNGELFLLKPFHVLITASILHYGEWRWDDDCGQRLKKVFHYKSNLLIDISQTFFHEL